MYTVYAMNKLAFQIKDLNDRVWQAVTKCKVSSPLRWSSWILNCHVEICVYNEIPNRNNVENGGRLRTKSMFRLEVPVQKQIFGCDSPCFWFFTLDFEHSRFRVLAPLPIN